MKRTQFYALGMVLIFTVCSALALAASPEQPSLVGTFKLVGRTDKDNSVTTAPSVIGLLTFTKTYRNFNVAWKNPAGKVFSYSVISKYTLTDSTYTETKLYSIMNDEISGAGVKCDFETQTKTVPVALENGKLTINMPFDPVTLVVEGDKMTGVGIADFVDSWFRVK